MPEHARTRIVRILNEMGSELHDARTMCNRRRIAVKHLEQFVQLGRALTGDLLALAHSGIPCADVNEYTRMQPVEQRRLFCDVLLNDGNERRCHMVDNECRDLLAAAPGGERTEESSASRVRDADDAARWTEELATDAEEEAARRARDAEEAARRVEEALRRARDAEDVARRAREAEEAARGDMEAEEAARRAVEAEEAARRGEEGARGAVEAEEAARRARGAEEAARRAIEAEEAARALEAEEEAAKREAVRALEAEEEAVRRAEEAARALEAEEGARRVMEAEEEMTRRVEEEKRVAEAARAAVIARQAAADREAAEEEAILRAATARAARANRRAKLDQLRLDKAAAIAYERETAALQEAVRSRGSDDAAANRMRASAREAVQLATEQLREAEKQDREAVEEEAVEEEREREEVVLVERPVPSAPLATPVQLTDEVVVNSAAILVAQTTPLTSAKREPIPVQVPGIAGVLSLTSVTILKEAHLTFYTSDEHDPLRPVSSVRVRFNTDLLSDEVRTTLEPYQGALVVRLGVVRGTNRQAPRWVSVAGMPVHDVANEFVTQPGPGVSMMVATAADEDRFFGRSPLSSVQFELVDVPGYGDCFYLAAWEALQFLETGENINTRVWSYERQARQVAVIRNQLWNYYRTLPADVRANNDVFYADRQMKPSQETYWVTMGKYADTVNIEAFANVFNVQVRVYNSSETLLPQHIKDQNVRHREQGLKQTMYYHVLLQKRYITEADLQTPTRPLVVLDNTPVRPTSRQIFLLNEDQYHFCAMLPQQQPVVNRVPQVVVVPPHMPAVPVGGFVVAQESLGELEIVNGLRYPVLSIDMVLDPSQVQYRVVASQGLWDSNVTDVFAASLEFASDNAVVQDTVRVLHNALLLMVNQQSLDFLDLESARRLLAGAGPVVKLRLVPRAHTAEMVAESDVASFEVAQELESVEVGDVAIEDLEVDLERLFDSLDVEEEEGAEESKMDFRPTQAPAPAAPAVQQPRGNRGKTVRIVAEPVVATAFTPQAIQLQVGSALKLPPVTTTPPPTELRQRRRIQPVLVSAQVPGAQPPVPALIPLTEPMELLSLPTWKEELLKKSARQELEYGERYANLALILQKTVTSYPNRANEEKLKTLRGQLAPPSLDKLNYTDFETTVRQLVANTLTSNQMKEFKAKLAVEVNCAKKWDTLFTLYKKCHNVQALLAPTLIISLERLPQKTGLHDSAFKEVATRLRSINFLGVLTAAYNSLVNSFLSQQAQWESKWKTTCQTTFVTGLKNLIEEFQKTMALLGLKPEQIENESVQLQKELEQGRESLRRFCSKEKVKGEAEGEEEGEEEFDIAAKILEAQKQIEAEGAKVKETSAARKARLEKARQDAQDIEAQFVQITKDVPLGKRTEYMVQDAGKDAALERAETSGEEEEDEDSGEEPDPSKCHFFKTVDECEINQCDWDEEAQRCDSPIEEFTKVRDVIRHTSAFGRSSYYRDLYPDM